MRAHPYRVVALGFVLVGGVYLAIAGADSSVTYDDGFYALPVTSMREEGSLSFDYVLADVDPEGIGAQRSVSSAENGFFTNIRRPAWILALAGADAVGGLPGQRLLVLCSGAAAVLAAGALARTVGPPRAALVAALLTALSPVLFNALQFWAHAPAAALVGGVLWSSMRVMDSDARVPARLVVVGLAGALISPALRTDSGLYMVAIAVVTGLTGLRLRRVAVAGFGAALGAVSVASHVATEYALPLITGQDTTRSLVTRGSGAADGRISGFLMTFVSGLGEERLAFVLLMAALVIAGYACLLIRRGEHRSGAVALGAAAMLWLMRLIIYPDELADGLLGAWPLALLVFAEPLRQRSMAERRTLAVVALAFLGVAATQYDVGGGLNWGGRFLSSGVVPIATLVACTLTRPGHVYRHRLLPAAAVALAFVVTMASLAADWDLRTSHDDLVTALEAAEPAVPVVTSSPALPNLAWRTYPEIDFVYVRDDDRAVDVREMLLEAGYTSPVGYLLSDEHFKLLTDGDAHPGEPYDVVEIDLEDG